MKSGIDCPEEIYEPREGDSGRYRINLDTDAPTGGAVIWPVMIVIALLILAAVKFL